MATLTIHIKNDEMVKAQKRARQEGFKQPSDWVRAIVERDLSLGESPKIPSDEIIERVKKTGRYQGKFLNGLKNSLEYADQTA